MAKQGTARERLESMKTSVVDGRDEKARLEGERRSVTAQLDTKFKVTSMVQVDKKLDELEDSERHMDVEINDGLKKLEEKYQW